jgi:5-methylcytosine-specific restriction endonuclease McrA
VTTRLQWKPKRPRLRRLPRVQRPEWAKRVLLETEGQRISHDTRLFVWARDGGRCRNCGSTTNLQFDHIIPRAWGGSGTAENVELLCRDCNLQKSARLFAPGRSSSNGAACERPLGFREVTDEIRDRF